jgi:hypothetical protein
VEIVIDLAVAGRVPAPMIRNAGGLLSPRVVAQQVPHLVNEQRRVFFDRVSRQPRVVVIQAPLRVDSHAVDQVSGDRNQAEERRREITALMGRAYASRLQRTAIPVGFPIRAANQVAECELHRHSRGRSFAICISS